MMYFIQFLWCFICFSCFFAQLHFIIKNYQLPHTFIMEGTLWTKNFLTKQAKSNVLTKKLIDQLQESMTYSSISFINWTIEVLTIIKNRLERGDRISDEVSGEVYTIHSFQKFVKANFSSYITSQVFKEISSPGKNLLHTYPMWGRLQSSYGRVRW